SYSFIICVLALSLVIIFSNAPAPTGIYPLSLHDALPIYRSSACSSAENPLSESCAVCSFRSSPGKRCGILTPPSVTLFVSYQLRSEEHTSELQSRFDLVCRLLLEKKKKTRAASRSVSRCV